MIDARLTQSMRTSERDESLPRFWSKNTFKIHVNKESFMHVRPHSHRLWHCLRHGTLIRSRSALRSLISCWNFPRGEIHTRFPLSPAEAPRRCLSGIPFIIHSAILSRLPMCDAFAYIIRNFCFRYFFSLFSAFMMGAFQNDAADE